MDIFSQKKFFIRIIIFLVLLNLLSISIFVWKSVYNNEPLLYPKNEDYKNVSGILKMELNLDEKQVSKFDEIRERYFFSIFKHPQISIQVFVDNESPTRFIGLDGR